MALKDSKAPAPTPTTNRTPSRASGSPGGRANGPAAARPRTSGVDEAGPLSMTGLRSGLMSSLGMKLVLGGIILIFAVPFLLPSLTGPADTVDGTANRPPGGGPDPVARVGDEVVSRDLFQRSFAQQVEFAQQFGQDTGPTGLLDLRRRALDSLASDAAKVAEAKKRGLSASEEDIDKYITEQINKQLEPQAGQTAASIRRQIESEGSTLEARREELRKNFDRELVARQVLLEKLEKAVKDENKVTEDDYKRANTKLALRQIKVSPKPAAPGAKDPKAAAEKAEADAKARAEKLAAQLKGATAAQFAAAAKKESDDVATKAKGGDLGTKLPSELGVSDEVRQALLKSSGSLVGPVQDTFTKDWLLFHVGGRKLELPKDFAKKKAELLKTFEEQQDGTAWSTFTTKLAEANKPQIEDPALVAYDIQTQQIGSAGPDQQKALREQAIAKYEEALQYAGGTEATAIRFQLAQQYAAAGETDKQLAALKTASENSNDRTVKLEYARALAAANKKDEALKLAAEISADIDKNPSPPQQSPFSFGGPQPNPDDTFRFQLSGLYEQMGKKDLAAKERAKVKPAPAPGAPGGAGGQTINLGNGKTINLGNVKVGGDKKPITIPAQ